jgi:hypothetical protein
VKSMPSPDVARFQNRPWFLDGLKTLERVEQDRPLLLYVGSLPKGMSEGIAQGEGSRRLDSLCDFLLERDADGRDAFGFDYPLDQAHGLIAEASRGGEKNGLGPVSNEALGDLGGCLLYESFQMRPVDVAHETI